LWPYLVMPLIVLLVFYALSRVHRHAANKPVSMAAPELRHASP